MKKVLVILLILAVSAGAFAQGEWGVSASARMESAFDGGPGLYSTIWPDYYPSAATIGTQNEVSGSGKITYKIGAFDSYVEFKRAETSLGVTGNGDNYSFKAATNFSGSAFNAGDLWGWYKFLDGMLQVGAGIAGDNIGDLWRSSDAGGGGFADAKGNKLWLNFSTQGFQAGVTFANVFPTAKNDLIDTLQRFVVGAKYTQDGVFDAAFNIGMNSYDVIGFTFINDDGTDEFYGATVMGAPMIFSFPSGTYGGTTIVMTGLNMYSTRMYFGVNLNMLDPLKIGASFLGEFLNKAEDDQPASVVSFGLKVEYSAGDFGGSVGFKFSTNSVKGDSNAGANIIEIKPSLWYNIIPESLKFNLDATIKIDTPKASGADSVTTIEIAPRLTYNFEQSGAQGWADPRTGMFVKYIIGFGKAGSADMTLLTNRAEFGFKWGI